ncbi:MAG: HEAT repeat domain-containing protein [Candidatus Margulisiibacteriota bacterium]
MNDGENYVEKLIGDLRHPEPQTRLRAAWLLGVKKEARAVVPLVKAIGENRDDPYILATIATALGLIGDIRALDEIVALLKNSYQVVRTAAAEAIGLIGNDRGIEPLKSVMDDRKTSVRKVAARALKNLADKEVKS